MKRGRNMRPIYRFGVALVTVAALSTAIANAFDRKGSPCRG
jgi:hypothetical protein